MEQYKRTFGEDYFKKRLVQRIPEGLDGVRDYIYNGANFAHLGNMSDSDPFPRNDFGLPRYSSSEVSIWVISKPTIQEGILCRRQGYDGFGERTLTESEDKESKHDDPFERYMILAIPDVENHSDARELIERLQHVTEIPYLEYYDELEQELQKKQTERSDLQEERRKIMYADHPDVYLEKTGEVMTAERAPVTPAGWVRPPDGTFPRDVSGDEDKYLERMRRPHDKRPHWDNRDRGEWIDTTGDWSDSDYEDTRRRLAAKPHWLEQYFAKEGLKLDSN